jgi:hypothetical protein
MVEVEVEVVLILLNLEEKVLSVAMMEVGVEKIIMMVEL